MKNTCRFIGLICLILLVVTLPALAEEIGGKVQIGSDIHITADQHVRGDSVSIFGSQKIEGKVDGAVVTIFGDLEMGGEIDNDVVTIFGKVILHDGAMITGDLVTVMGKVTREGSVHVGGDQTSVDVGQIGGEVFRNFDFHFRDFNFWRFPFFKMFNLSGFVFSLLLTLLVAHFFMPNVKVIADVVEHDLIRTGLKGLLGVIAIALGLFLLGITIIGIPVAVILALAAWVAVNFGAVAVYYLIGERLFNQFQKETTDLVKALIGALIIGVIAVFPLAGLIKLVIGWIGLGAVLDTKFGTKRPWVE